MRNPWLPVLAVFLVTLCGYCHRERHQLLTLVPFLPPS
jgi:hypothetical protein